MAYLGNEPITNTLPKKVFSGDGTTTAFVLDVAAVANHSVLVYVGGVYQEPGVSYTANGVNLNFTEAPPTGTNNITAVSLGHYSELVTPAADSVSKNELSSTNEPAAYDVVTVDAGGNLDFEKVQFGNLLASNTTLSNAGANISWNVDLAHVATVTLNGNKTLDNPTNMEDGQTYLLIVKQDGTGGYTLSYGTAYKWPEGGIIPVISTVANNVDIISFVSDGTSMFGIHQEDFA